MQGSTLAWLYFFDMERLITCMFLLYTHIALSQTYFSNIYGLPYPYVETFWGGISVPDSGYLCSMTGFNYLLDTNAMYLSKFDREGSLVWGKSYGEAGTSHETYQIKPFGVNYLIVGGERKNDTASAIIFKVSPEGDSLWLKTYNDTSRTCFFDNIHTTSDGGLIAVGASEKWDTLAQESLYKQIYVVKTDSLGNQEWSLTHGLYEFNDQINDIIELPDYSFLAVGFKAYIYISDFFVNSMIYHISATGVILSEQEFHTDLVNHALSVIQPTADGNYLVCGMYANDDWLHPDPHGTGGILIKLNPEGDTLWWKWYGDDIYDLLIYDMVQLADGSIVCVGYRIYDQSEPILAKFSPDGEVLWYRVYNYNIDKGECLFDIEACYDGGFILSGYATPLGVVGNNASDAWLIKVDSMGCPEPNCVITDDTHTPIQIARIEAVPNPASQQVSLQGTVSSHVWELAVRMYSASGQLMYQTKVPTPSDTLHLDIDISTWPAGVYSYHTISSDGTWGSSGRVVVVR